MGFFQCGIARWYANKCLTNCWLKRNAHKYQWSGERERGWGRGTNTCENQTERLAPRGLNNCWLIKKKKKKMFAKKASRHIIHECTHVCTHAIRLTCSLPLHNPPPLPLTWTVSMLFLVLVTWRLKGCNCKFLVKWMNGNKMQKCIHLATSLNHNQGCFHNFDIWLKTDKLKSTPHHYHLCSLTCIRSFISLSNLRLCQTYHLTREGRWASVS